MDKEDTVQFSQFSRSVVSDSLQPHELQHARPPCPSPTPGVHSNSRPLSQWCHPTISFSVAPFSSCPQPFPASLVFSSESALLIRWPKYWSFSFSMSPSKEHPGWISFRMDWLDLLAVQGTLPIITPLIAIIKPSTIFWMKKKRRKINGRMSGKGRWGLTAGLWDFSWEVRVLTYSWWKTIVWDRR